MKLYVQFVMESNVVAPSSFLLIMGGKEHKMKHQTTLQTVSYAFQRILMRYN